MTRGRLPDNHIIVLSNINRYMTLRQMERSELCERSGINPRTYHRREKREGNRDFDLTELTRIARALDVTVADLVTT